jgi:nitroreductase/NAD-dependent dihydropyrimidine dehydrogenase PreA subunit
MKNEHLVSVDLPACNRCGLCVKDCPQDAWAITDTGADILTQECMKCGHCVAICPQNAVKISGFEDMPEEIGHDAKPDPETMLSMMKGRRSIRHFTKEDVPPEIIDKIIEAGRYTPTGRNTQGVSYVVLRENKSEYEKIAVAWFRRLRPIVGVFMKHFRHLRIDDNFFFKGAPVVIVIKSDNPGTAVVDGAIAASAMELTARAYGLGALYLGFFPIIARMSRTLKRKLSAEAKGKVVTTLVLGYPAVQYCRTAQRERPVFQYD